MSYLCDRILSKLYINIQTRIYKRDTFISKIENAELSHDPQNAYLHTA